MTRGAGYATAAASAGVEERKIANVTRHENLSVLRMCPSTAAPPEWRAA